MSEILTIALAAYLGGAVASFAPYTFIADAGGGPVNVWWRGLGLALLWPISWIAVWGHE